MEAKVQVARLLPSFCVDIVLLGGCVVRWGCAVSQVDDLLKFVLVYLCIIGIMRTIQSQDVLLGWPCPLDFLYHHTFCNTSPPFIRFSDVYNPWYSL